jgi:uncharacterized protein (TIGR03086 family)
MDTVDLLDRGYAWTAARIAAVPAGGLDAPTPCTLWTLRDLLDHTIGALTVLTDAVAGPPGSDAADDPGSGDPGGDLDGGDPGGGDPDGGTGGGRAPGGSDWDLAIARLAARSRRAWQAPGVMDRTIALPIGELPAPAVASISLLEAVVHGWDIGQGSGEVVDIPDDLALAVLDIARSPLVDSHRGDNFAADLGIGDTPSDQLVAFLGRKPR